ncbi:peptidoglycan-binding protein [Sulfitobacter aestuarii]|uniref:Peptidoglycan-binding protein n=1 Tax=Sulfitobacter aestuarii TaxID=2161676 RepID=A0ABW5TZA1_9RHOB
MKRRHFITGLGAAALTIASAPALQAQMRIDILRQRFEMLPASDRRKVQTELSYAGLYNAAIDGSYGPGTERALVAGARYLEDNSRGRVRVDLAAAAGVNAYVTGLVNGSYAAWLYGEGGECDGC